MIRIKDEWRYYDEELGIPYPWYTSPCLEYLQSLDLKDKKVFEYGVGDSTIWFRKKCGVYNVNGVDTNRAWTEKIGMVFYQPYYPFYCQIIEKGGKFDIVVIDGEWRDECTQYALEALNPGGILIIDNYKQPSVLEHWPLTEKLIEDMEQIIFKEPEHEDWQTLIVFK